MIIIIYIVKIEKVQEIKDTARCIIMTKSVVVFIKY